MTRKEITPPLCQPATPQSITNTTRCKCQPSNVLPSEPHNYFLNGCECLNWSNRGSRETITRCAPPEAMTGKTASNDPLKFFRLSYYCPGEALHPTSHFLSPLPTTTSSTFSTPTPTTSPLSTPTPMTCTGALGWARVGSSSRSTWAGLL